MEFRFQLYKTPIIVCEGASEMNYLMSLNRLLVRGTYAAFCKPVVAGGGDFSTVCKEYKRMRGREKRLEVFIWVDKDIYVRNH